MTKNFIELYETYKDGEGDHWTCVARAEATVEEAAQSQKD